MERRTMGNPFSTEKPPDCRTPGPNFYGKPKDVQQNWSVGTAQCMCFMFIGLFKIIN